MGCGASATVKTDLSALEARVSLHDFKQWYLKLLVKDASKAAKVGRARVCEALAAGGPSDGQLTPCSRHAAAQPHPPCARPPNPLQ